MQSSTKSGTTSAAQRQGAKRESTENRRPSQIWGRGCMALVANRLVEKVNSSRGRDRDGSRRERSAQCERKRDYQPGFIRQFGDLRKTLADSQRFG